MRSLNILTSPFSLVTILPPMSDENDPPVTALKLGNRKRPWVDLIPCLPHFHDIMAQSCERSLGSSWAPFRQDGACHVQRPSSFYKHHSPFEREWGSRRRVAHSRVCVDILSHSAFSLICLWCRARKEYKVFQQLEGIVPHLHECLMGCSEEESMTMADLVRLSPQWIMKPASRKICLIHNHLLSHDF